LLLYSENLALLCLTLTWEAEFKSDELGSSQKRFSNSVEDMA
jgi:hypothetical protein